MRQPCAPAGQQPVQPARGGLLLGMKYIYAGMQPPSASQPQRSPVSQVRPLCRLNDATSWHSAWQLRRQAPGLVHTLHCARCRAEPGACARRLHAAAMGGLGRDPGPQKLCSGSQAQVPLELQGRIAQLVQGAAGASAPSLADAWTSLAACLDEACRSGPSPDAATSIVRALLGISVDEVRAPCAAGSMRRPVGILRGGRGATCSTSCNVQLQAETGLDRPCCTGDVLRALQAGPGALGVLAVAAAHQRQPAGQHGARAAPEAAQPGVPAAPRAGQHPAPVPARPGARSGAASSRRLAEPCCRACSGSVSTCVWRPACLSCCKQCPEQPLCPALQAHCEPPPSLMYASRLTAPRRAGRLRRAQPHAGAGGQRATRAGPGPGGPVGWLAGRGLPAELRAAHAGHQPPVPGCGPAELTHTLQHHLSGHEAQTRRS